MTTFSLHPGTLKSNDIAKLLNDQTTLELNPACLQAIDAAESVITNCLKEDKVVYGVNTGFGALAHTRIKTSDIEELQKRIVLSHAAGTGSELDERVVRLILALKINSLARGYSGIRRTTLEALLKLYNQKIYPCIPSQGSVGASGDLAPLAHMTALLLGKGQAQHKGKILSAEAALDKLNMPPLKLAAKEGLALLNGTQVSTAIALVALMEIEKIFIAACITGALSVDALRASDVPFAACIQDIRGHQGQSDVAAFLRQLLSGSTIRKSHETCEKVQDPYSIRCQPQVMGACLTQLKYAKSILMIEANAVSDNPLVFSEHNSILSGGNFHAEPVAFAADAMAIALAEIGALSERRIALLIDPQFSGLTAFLVNEPGLNSGFMLAQVTAAALTSENKSLAHPASVDSIPTSNNQEDHVSMATFAAHRLFKMIENVTTIIGIELLSACQGIDFLRPLTSSSPLEQIHHLMREQVPFYAEDRFFAPDIAAAKRLVQSGKLSQIVRESVPFDGIFN